MRHQLESRANKNTGSVTINDSSVRTRRVAVVALGVISPLGTGSAETLQALRVARDCVTPVTRFAVQQCRCQTAGQVPDETFSKRPNGRRKKNLHRASLMMITAVEQALAQDPQFQPEIAVIGTTSGGMSFGEDYYRALQSGGSLRRTPAWLANYPPQKPVIDALAAFGISAPCQVIANACASGTNAIGHAFACIRSGVYVHPATHIGGPSNSATGDTL